MLLKRRKLDNSIYLISFSFSWRKTWDKGLPVLEYILLETVPVGRYVSCTAPVVRVQLFPCILG